MPASERQDPPRLTYPDAYASRTPCESARTPLSIGWCPLPSAEQGVGTCKRHPETPIQDTPCIYRRKQQPTKNAHAAMRQPAALDKKGPPAARTAPPSLTRAIATSARWCRTSLFNGTLWPVEKQLTPRSASNCSGSWPAGASPSTRIRAVASSCIHSRPRAWFRNRDAAEEDPTAPPLPMGSPNVCPSCGSQSGPRASSRASSRRSRPSSSCTSRAHHGERVAEARLRRVSRLPGYRHAPSSRRRRRVPSRALRVSGRSCSSRSRRETRRSCTHPRRPTPPAGSLCATGGT